MPFAQNSAAAPHRPPLAFRVGVVGHRPERLKGAELPALRARVAEVLATVKVEVLRVAAVSGSPYGKTPARLVAVSPLAEGADRLFADAALSLGFELTCVMPFPEDEYKKDFDPPLSAESNARADFAALLERGRQNGPLTRFELDGDRTAAGAAYGTCGRVVINQSDLLLVVWDGERLGKSGGTEETLDEALRQGVPVVWVDARAPHAWQLLGKAKDLPSGAVGQRRVPSGDASQDEITNSVHDLLSVPKHRPRHAGAPKVETPTNSLARFYREGKPRWKGALAWRLFVRSVGRSTRPIHSAVPPGASATVDEWSSDDVSLSTFVGRVRSFFSWPDELAVVHADRYRSAFLLAFLFAAMAVGLAFMPYALHLKGHGVGETLFAAGEFGTVVTILVLVLAGKQGRWHEQWLEYRLAAELVRGLRLIAPIGGERLVPKLPAQWASYGDPASSWMAWYLRAVERSCGLPSVCVTRDYLRSALVHIRQVLWDQLGYHEVNARRCDTIERRLHRTGAALFATSVLACLLHLFTGIGGIHLAERILRWLTFSGAFGPALGASLAGIANQGEFRRLARRSEAMKEKFEGMLKTVDHLETLNDKAVSAGQLSSEVSALSVDVARLMVNEALDWRVVFLDRPLETPA